MDYKSIEQLIKTASENELNYLEIETEGIRIKMQKGQLNSPVQVASGNVEATVQKKEESAITEVEVPVVKETSVAKEVIQEKEEIVQDDENIKAVVSPIVGTFYASGSPDADDFVRVGTKVKKGQTLCIIEAMKLMNEIEAEFDGEIVEILVQKEQMVEYGQELFKIRI